MEEVFDSKYSDEVSLSRILDYFLLSDEKPDTVMEFMASHSDRTEEILHYSDCCAKMMQSDFLKGLGQMNVERFFDVLDSAKPSMVAPLCSQVFYRREEFDDVIVGRCVRLLRSISERTGMAHRYAGQSGKYGKMLDAAFMLGKDAAYVAENMPTDFFSNMSLYMKHSIFEGRILQMDFYEALSPLNRRVLLKNIGKGTPDFTMRFIRQMLTYDVDVNEKYELFRTVKNGRIWRMPQEYGDGGMKGTLDELMGCESYAEFSIRTTLVGMDANRDLIFNMLFTSKNLGVLFEMAEEDRGKLDGICRISSLLDCIKDSMFNKRNPMPKRGMT